MIVYAKGEMGVGEWFRGGNDGSVELVKNCLTFT
jgi:hypothetical protein